MLRQYKRKYKGWTISIEQTAVKHYGPIGEFLEPYSPEFQQQFIKLIESMLPYDGRGNILHEEKKIIVAYPFSGNSDIVSCLFCHELGHLVHSLLKPGDPQYLYAEKRKNREDDELVELLACEYGREIILESWPNLLDIFDEFSRGLMRFKCKANDFAARQSGDLSDMYVQYDIMFEKKKMFFQETAAARSMARDSIIKRGGPIAIAMLEFAFKRIEQMIDQKQGETKSDNSMEEK